jgi:dTDP-4-dehydrorhamnose 3,5-epimerase
MGINFNFKESNVINGVWIITPTIAEDNRGNIWTSFLKDEIEKLLPGNLYFKHDKFSQSKQNVLRGIHGDEKSWKLVTCVHGSIQQVAVDCRKESDTFTKYESFEINQINQISVLIPPRFGNAYFVRSKNAVYHYKLAYEGDYIDAGEQFSYKWNDPTFNIKWPNDKPILSTRDAR